MDNPLREKRNFENSIKKDITENVIKRLLMDAGYLVEHSGIESLIPHVERMDLSRYVQLSLPKALRELPDFFVLDIEKNERFFVQIKFRTDWDNDLFISLQDAVQQYGEIILVYILANHSSRKEEFGSNPSGYLRCCRLKYDPECNGGVAEVLCRNEKYLREEEPLSNFGQSSEDWWRLHPIQNIFGRLNARKTDSTIHSVIESIRGILHQNI